MTVMIETRGEVVRLQDHRNGGPPLQMTSERWPAQLRNYGEEIDDGSVLSYADGIFNRDFLLVRVS